ncbi:MAG: type III pantothenate kinase [Clostridia bacterium]|nr:type III pantothenate kinase [Clostridia bacterium]
MKILAVDVGNTHTVVGVFEDERLVRHFRFATVASRTADEHAALLYALAEAAGDEGALALAGLAGVVVSSVVPPLTQAWQEYGRRYLGLEAAVVTAGSDLGVPLRVDRPNEVGADRIVNALAALERYGAPVIVVDLGTATTFDAIASDGAFVGGAIAPGIAVATEALFARTAQLPRVELVRPPAAIGRNTVHNIQSGIVYGFAGQIDGVVRRIARELGGSPRVVATGGLAELVAAEAETIDTVDPYLTLEGLRIAYHRMHGGRGGAASPRSGQEATTRP